jgi:predicted transcriptional regulator
MPSIPSSIDAEDFRKMLRDQIEKMDCTHAEYAATHGISASYLSDVLNGRREPGEKLLAAKGMKRAVYYEWK